MIAKSFDYVKEMKALDLNNPFLVLVVVCSVVGLRMAAVVWNSLVVEMSSANLTLVAMCSVVGSMMVAARCAIFTLLLETPPAFGLVDTEVFGS